MVRPRRVPHMQAKPAHLKLFLPDRGFQTARRGHIMMSNGLWTYVASDRIKRVSTACSQDANKSSFFGLPADELAADALTKAEVSTPAALSRVQTAEAYCAACSCFGRARTRLPPNTMPCSMTLQVPPFATCGARGVKGLRRAKGMSHAHLPVQILTLGDGAGGFSIPQHYRFMDAANPWRRLRAVASHLCAVRHSIRSVTTLRAWSPWELSRGKRLLAPEVSDIRLLRPTLLAPEQLKGGASDPAARIESHAIRTVF